MMMRSTPEHLGYPSRQYHQINHTGRT
ncbi:hypothetical protein RSAG8_13156, partial [Rhizoctonia solani AG-8 WAC10335]